MFERLKYRKPRGLALLGVVAAVGLALAATGGAVLAKGSSPAAVKSAEAAPLVALMLSENLNPRWEAVDRPYFKAAMKKYYPSAKVDIVNALNSPEKQQNQAETELTKGAKVLVIVGVDVNAAARIGDMAKKEGVAVISYSHLIHNGYTTALVGFDALETGRLQGRWLAAHTKKGDRIAVFAGNPTDNNAHLFKRGADSILNPLFKSGARIQVGPKAGSWTADWDPAKAQAAMEQILTQTKNKVDGVLSPNDGLAGGIIAALGSVGLAGKVPVTGLDAEVAALQRILLGTQGMTTDQNIPQQARVAARLATYYLKGQKPPKSMFNATTFNGKYKVPSALQRPRVIEKTNVSVLIKEGLVKKTAVCKGIPKGTGPC